MEFYAPIMSSVRNLQLSAEKLQLPALPSFLKTHDAATRYDTAYTLWVRAA